MCKRFVALEKDGKKPLYIKDNDAFTDDIQNNWVVQKELQEHNMNPDKFSYFLKDLNSHNYNIFLYGRNTSENDYIVFSSRRDFEFYILPLEGGFVGYYKELHGID